MSTFTVISSLLRGGYLKPQQKAGLIPYIYENGQPRFLFMISSNAKFGGLKPMISKGGIDPGETIREASIREAEEELGLISANIKHGTLKLGWTGLESYSRYLLTVYTCEVIDRNRFNKPHYETAKTVWLTAAQFRKIGRKDHIQIVEHIARSL